MTRSVGAVLVLAALAEPASAQFPGSSSTNPRPAAGVQIGSVFYYSQFTVTIVGYGWTPDGYPYVLVQDSYDNSYYWVTIDGGTLTVTHPRPGLKAGDMVNLTVGFTVEWDGATDTIGIALWNTDLRFRPTWYGPIPYWEIPASPGSG
jgi:hypothetical protein